MKYFSVPADFKRETIDKYHELNQRYDDSELKETYGQLTFGKVLNSGRVIEAIPGVDYKELEDYVNYSSKRGIWFNYTLNPACMGNFEFSEEGVRAIKILLRNLYNMGISSLTLTMPALVELTKSMNITFEIKASAICEVMTPGKALFYKNLGAGRLVVDPDITRDFRRLKNICHVFGSGVEIIVNNVCYRNCAYKMFHYNHEAHRVSQDESHTVTDYYFNRCAMQKAGDLKNVIRLSWIRPEDLKYYREVGISWFKLQGRQNVLEGDPVRALEAYMKEDFQGNLYDLITIFAPYTAFQPYIDNKKLEGFVKRYFDDPDFCQGICSHCHYCEQYAKKSMNLEDAEGLNKQALKYFNEVDSYMKLLDKEKPGENKGKKFKSQDTRFDFE